MIRNRLAQICTSCAETTASNTDIVDDEDEDEFKEEKVKEKAKERAWILWPWFRSTASKCSAVKLAGLMAASYHQCCVLCVCVCMYKKVVWV